MPAEARDIHTSEAFDLAVIGAGVIGLACAWRAAQAGLDVVVLERDEPGAGASGVAAGMLAPVTEADFGEQELLRLNLESRAEWPAFAAELEERSGLPTGYADSGALVVAADRDDAEELRRLHDFQQRLGLESEWLPPREARRLEPGLSPRIGGAILAPQDGHADPGAVVRALATALSEAGGTLRNDASAEAIQTDGAGRVAGVRVAGGELVRAPRVVAAAGAWTGERSLGVEVAAPEVRPLKGQLLELRVRDGRRPPAQRLIRTPRCYVVTRADGRVVIGATNEEQGFDTTVTADGVYRLLEAAYEVLPDVSELELVRARAGLRPVTPGSAPVIEAGVLDGLTWATGHGRNGVLLAPATARRVVDLVRRSGDRVGSA
jgi:glycine oxidase